MTGESQNCVIENESIFMLTFGALKIFYEKRQRSLINNAVFLCAGKDAQFVHKRKDRICYRRSGKSGLRSEEEYK